jgi:tetratricopeptide (TPR) repeat protein
VNPLRAQLQSTVDRAISIHQQGRVPEAEKIYREVLKQDPGNPDALHLLGLIAHHANRPEPAIELITRAIASDPSVPLYHMNLARVYRGAAKHEEALASATRAAQINPAFVEAHVERAAALKALDRLDEAESAARAAVRAAPGHPGGHGALANVLADQGRFDQAMEEYRTTLKIAPDWAEALSNYGEALRKRGKYAEAEPYFRRAIALTPEVGDPHFNLSIVLLVTGRFDEGWREYEWRWRQIGVQMRVYDPPLWDGSDLGGKSIILWSEQGLGDTIQFIRYVPMLRQRGAGKIVVVTDRPIANLVRTVEGIEEVYIKGDTLPRTQSQCPIVSLPLKFNTTLESIPARVPYISVDSQMVAWWRERLQPSSAKKNVGIAWAGSAVNKNDRNRSARLSDFSPLAGVANVRFISLQIGAPSKQLTSAPTGLQIDDATPDVRDFNDAALIAQLDLVITVDTSICHVAGALARPVWTLLPFVPDWRWLLDRDDTPWYPTMRLFRQNRRGDWSDVMARVRDELVKFAGAPRA